MMCKFHPSIKNILHFVFSMKKTFQKIEKFQTLFILFKLFEWTPSLRKEVGIPLGISPHVWEQNKHSYFPRPGQS